MVLSLEHDLLMSAAAKTQRLDARLVAEGLCVDLHEAQAFVLAGRVMVGEQKAQKAGMPVALHLPLRLIGGPPMPYVSRGGVKLEGALRELGVDVVGKHCIDVGASTGGFTDCLLQRGAAEVVAVDIGFGLLHDKLRRDERVHVLERTHARALTPSMLPWPADLLVMDVSFIGARSVLPALVPLCRPGGQLLIMVKPQFEAAREDVEPGGVVRDDTVRWQTVAQVETLAEALGCRVLGRAESQLHGPMGNREIFVLLQRTESAAPLDADPRA